MAGADGERLRLCRQARPLSRSDSARVVREQATGSLPAAGLCLTYLPGSRARRPVRASRRRATSRCLPNGSARCGNTRSPAECRRRTNRFRDRPQYPIAGSIATYVGGSSVTLLVRSRTVLQHQAARLGDGPRSRREPDVRAPGYLLEVWTRARERPRRRLLAEARLRQARRGTRRPSARAAPPPAPDPERTPVAPLPGPRFSFAVPAQRLELLDKPGGGSSISSRPGRLLRSPHRVGDFVGLYRPLRVRCRIAPGTPSCRPSLDAFLPQLPEGPWPAAQAP